MIRPPRNGTLTPRRLPQRTGRGQEKGPSAPPGRAAGRRGEGPPDKLAPASSGVPRLIHAPGEGVRRGTPRRAFPTRFAMSVVGNGLRAVPDSFTRRVYQGTSAGITSPPLRVNRAWRTLGST